MPNTIHIPTPLRPFTDKQEAVQVDGATVGELLTDLTTRHSGLRKHLYTDEGRLRNFVNVYLNDEDIRYLQKEATPVASGDTMYTSSYFLLIHLLLDYGPSTRRCARSLRARSQSTSDTGASGLYTFITFWMPSTANISAASAALAMNSSSPSRSSGSNFAST